ncbi:MAG TPA: LytR family transcriptional regulator [Clostridiales bacterium]|nr:LytR family transcriptional regulator [Clostridiales bacterium]
MDDRNVEDILKKQVNDIMNEQPQNGYRRSQKKKPVKKKKHRFLKRMGTVAGILLIAILIVFGTKPGRSMVYKFASQFLYNYMNKDLDNGKAKDDLVIDDNPHLRKEDYVTNYLIFGIEKIGGANNTDTIMIATINTKNNTLKLTSLLRDSYVDIPGHKANKLNSAYSRGGAKLLIETVQDNYKVKIDGYASVDFESFEKIVDLLGGVTIELGKKEAAYLNKTNYISKKKNRNVKEGINKLNGNQLMGYVRVRKVETLGGANNDYGRVVRQQRALKAMFESYIKSNVFKLPGITKEILGHITTNVSEDQIAKAMANVVENRITTLDTIRIPVDGSFDAPKKYNGVGYPIVLNWDVNRVELYKFIYDDTEEEAKEALGRLQ